MHEKKCIFCRTESVAMMPKSRDHMPTTSLWGVTAKWPTWALKTKLILCPRDPQGYSRITEFEPVRQDFERVPEHRVNFKANPMRYSMGFAKSHSLKCSLHKWAWCGAARKSVNFFVDHMHTQFTEESKMATALTPQTDVTSREAYRKQNRLKTQLNILFFYFIKSETSDSFVNHFDGHFAYLKTLDFYFKHPNTTTTYPGSI